jgi:dTMP kinase
VSDAVLLAVEGVDGAGKRSVCEAIIARTRSLGLSAKFFTFPNYESPTGTAIANYLRRPEPQLGPEAAAMLFACDRLNSRELLREALSSSDLVVVDRYVNSNAAYQAARIPPGERDTLATWVRDLEHGLMAMPLPTLTILLEVSPDESRRRTSTRQGSDRPDEDHYESSRDLLVAASEQYRQFAAEPGWNTINTTNRSVGHVIEDAWLIARRAIQP